MALASLPAARNPGPPPEPCASSIPPLRRVAVTVTITGSPLDESACALASPSLRTCAVTTFVPKITSQLIARKLRSGTGPVGGAINCGGTYLAVGHGPWKCWAHHWSVSSTFLESIGVVHAASTNSKLNHAKHRAIEAMASSFAMDRSAYSEHRVHIHVIGQLSEQPLMLGLDLHVCVESDIDGPESVGSAKNRDVRI